MSDCIHCQIHDLLESHLQNPEANVADIAFKVTEVLADLILMASPENQGMLIVPFGVPNPRLQAKRRVDEVALCDDID